MMTQGWLDLQKMPGESEPCRQLLSEECLEQWFVQGEPCKEVPEIPLDATWLWVNGSDPKWREKMQEQSRAEGIYSPEHHYREQDELRYSLRAARHVPFNQLHLVVAMRDGKLQVPLWLNTSHPLGPRLVGHDTFIDKSYLPAYQSKVIEAHLHQVRTLSPVSVALNDDFFVLNAKRDDFYHPLTGPVFRFDDNYLQQVRPRLDHRYKTDGGETGGLWYANHILSQRFPRRLRPYLAHGPKVALKHIHAEVAQTFREPLDQSYHRHFRESRNGQGGISFLWLATAYQVERWREALLWSFLVCRLSQMPDPSNVLLRIIPDTGDVVRRLPDDAGTVFSSLDGHIPPLLRPGEPSRRCRIEPSCIGPFPADLDHEALFKRMTFEKPDCGDCLITRLVALSGTRGLAAFLPHATLGGVPGDIHLPLHRSADFRPPLHTNLRLYCLRLLERYVYTTARRHDAFHSLHGPQSVTEITTDTAAVLCLNDDIREGYEDTKIVLQKWLQSRWPTPGVWETEK